MTAAALDSEGLAQLPPSAEWSDLFAYRALDEPDAPPDADARHRLARRYVDEENGPERIRLVLVTGYDPVRDTLDCVAYIWRAERSDVVWGLERWPEPQNRLRLYTLDREFSPEAVRRLHERYRTEGAQKVSEDAREILRAGGEDPAGSLTP